MSTIQSKKKKKTTGNNNSDNNSKKAWFKKKKKSTKYTAHGQLQNKEAKVEHSKKKKNVNNDATSGGNCGDV